MGTQKGLVQRIERKIEATVGDAFARVFGGSIVPQEVEAMLRREAEDGVRSLEGDHLLAPNEYFITLGVHDYENTGADPDLTADTFAKHLTGYICEQGWQTYGDVVVRFEQSTNLHTGQFRARGSVNPDVTPRPTVSNAAPPQSIYAFSAEPGVTAMTDNTSYRGGQGEGRPGDDYYDDRYGHQQEDPRGAPEPPGGQDPFGGPEPHGQYPPEQGGYPPQQESGYPPARMPEQGGYPGPGSGGHPDQGQGGYPGPGSGGYPDQGSGGYPERGSHPDQGGYPDQGQGGYPSSPSYGQQPVADYGGSRGYDEGHRSGPGGYGAPGGQPDYGNYGRGPVQHDQGGYGQPEQRPSYPDQGGGYDQGYQGEPSYGRQDYGQPSPARYAEPPSGYAEPAGGGYDYGQPAAQGGYDGYGGQGGYAAPGSTVTLQLDDGSGRTYQLRQGTNVVGRGQDAQFRLPDTGVSRRHLEISWDGQVALLSDLNSTNGTTVNNSPVQEWQLADGDVIRLGHSEIVVRVH